MTAVSDLVWRIGFFAVFVPVAAVLLVLMWAAMDQSARRPPPRERQVPCDADDWPVSLDDAWLP